MLMPISVTLFVFVIKYNNDILKNKASDFTSAYFGIASVFWQLSCIFGIYFDQEFTFEWGKWANGFVASLFNLTGCLFAISAFAVAPIGPCAAFMNLQTIIMVVIYAVIDK